MKTIVLTDCEHELILGVLKEVDDLNSVTSCCDDWQISNTPENFAMVEEMGAWNCHMDVEAFRASEKYKDEGPRTSPDGKQIYIPRFFAYAYAMYLLKEKVR